MPDMGPLGITIIFIALTFFGLGFAFLHIAPRVQIAVPTPPPIPPGITGTNDAVLIVQAGGRVLYLNKLAREWFGLLEEEPNLERMARRARPSEIFLGLCAAEGQARFSLNGRFVEGSSFFFSYENTGAILVSVRHSQTPTLTASLTTVSEEAVKIFAELNKSMAASLDLKTTLQSILESVERLIPADFAEICVWDEDHNYLIPYHFVGMQGVDRRLERSGERYRADKGYSGHLITKREPLSISDVDAHREVRPAIDHKQYLYNSYLGIPLLVANGLVGTLELASLTKNAFTENDAEVLRILSGQASVAVHNALLYQEEQRRIIELSGLSQLAHAVSAIQDPTDLYSRLVESIRPLMNVELIGFWIYDENQHSLKAQIPFIGLPPEATTLYHIVVQPNSKAEEILLSQEMIIATNAPEDDRLEYLELAQRAQATGIKNTVLTPLTSGGRMMGYLQTADRVDGEPFDQNDIRLLSVIATQAAIIIENATLVQQTQRRALRSEALRRIASLTSSAATLDEIMQYSIQELARLLQADMAAVLLLDENQGKLRLHNKSLFGVSSDSQTRLGRFSIEAGQSLFASHRETSQKTFITGDAFEEIKALEIYRPLIDALQLRTVINVPLMVRDRTIGEILLANRATNFYDRSDVILIATAAGQLASAIEQSVLYKQTDESMRRRLDHLTSVTHISRELNNTTDLKHVLKKVYDEIVYNTRANCGSILLFSHDPESTNVKVEFSIGDSHAERLTALEHRVLDQEEPLIVEDFEAYASDFDHHHILPPHTGIKSSLIVPIVYKEQTTGLIHLHSHSSDCFDEMALDVAQTLAIQAALAIGNARQDKDQILKSELLTRRVETLAKLFDTTKALRLDQALELSMETIACGIQEATGFEKVVISIYDPGSEDLKRVAAAGLSDIEWREAHLTYQPWLEVMEYLQPEYRLGQSYFIPRGRALDPLADFTNFMENQFSQEEKWDSDDLLLAPLITSYGEPLGLISVDKPSDDRRPDRPAIETIEIFANQAALVIEGHNHIKAYQDKADVLEDELELANRSTETTRTQLPALLHKDLEQTIQIQQLSQRVRRIRAGLDIAEIVNRQNDRSQVLAALGSELLTRMELDVVIVAEPSSGGPRLSHILGPYPPGTNPGALLGQRNPLRQCLLTGETLLVHNIEESPEWGNSPLIQSLEVKGFICLAIPAEKLEQNQNGRQSIASEGGKPGDRNQYEAALLATSVTPLPPFTSEDEQLFILLARQVAIALQNQRLLFETSRRLREVNLLLDFSRRLGSLDPIEILDTLLQSAFHVVPSAQTGLVALWNTEQGCLIPQAAHGYQDNQRILEIHYLPGEALPGQVFENGQAVRVDEVDFARHYNLLPENLISYRNATGGRLPVSSLIIPIANAMHTEPEAAVESQSKPALPLGIILLDNFQLTAAFSEEDQALITSLAQQTALTLENARLYQASEQRAFQLQTLTDVAATITSSLQTDDLISSLLDQLKTVMPYDTGTLWLRQGNRLTIRAARGFEDSEDRVGLAVEIEDSLLLIEMINTGKPIYVEDVRKDSRFPTLIEHQYSTWLGIPLISKSEVVGVIALEKSEPRSYAQEHIQAATTFTGQAAVALENANLYEESVRRAVELDERSTRLALLNRLSVELSGTLEPAHILTLTLQNLHPAIHCYGTSALLFDKSGVAMLQAESTRTAEELPIPLPNAPIFERLRESYGVYNLEDVVDPEGVITHSLLAPIGEYLLSRHARSLLVLPLSTGSDLHGVILAYKDQPYRFNPDEVELARTIANQAAVAIQNAQLFRETQLLFAETRQRSSELAALFELGVKLSQILEQHQLIDIIFENLTSLLELNSVALALQDEAGELTALIIDRGEKVGPLAIERTGKSFSEYVLSTGQPLVFGDIQRDIDKLPVPGVSVGDPVRSWLGIPLVVRSGIIGVLSVQSDLPDQFGKEQVSLVGQVANQLAVSLENARLISTVQNYAADLEKRVAERTTQLAREHQRTETLLGIITELSTSLDMDIVLNRTLALINETVQAEHSAILLDLPEERNLFIRAALGYIKGIPKGGKSSTFKRREGLAGWVIGNRQAILIPDVLEDERWVQRDDQTSLHRSAMAVPLMMGEEVLGALLLYHRVPGQFYADHLELVQATAKQIAVAINNAQLFNLIRDQAERLGDMLRQQHVETSRSQAILEAVADGVLVTDANRGITLFNASAEQILGLQRHQVLGRSLEHFTGLFGKAGQTWVETIQTWSEDPSSYQIGDIYTEQIELEDKRVVSVHLSPVRLRNDFLGTVSTFRDITHQVEVDRLKSEFVATVSHELRTPMTSIKGYVEILLMGAAGNLSDQQSHFLQIVKTNTERLAILVNDLLDVSRIEAGKVELTIQPLDMVEIGTMAITELTRRMKEEMKPMQVNIEASSDLPHVYGDSQRVRQILDNLLENAFYYTPDNGQITLIIHPEDNYLQIDVKDNGIGILPKDQPRVFERFYRGEDPLVLATSGTGLGLSIVQRLIEMHKGKIWLFSSGIPGEGSTFSFNLPIFRPED
jgi:PAS domain S-box-containing protein